MESKLKAILQYYYDNFDMKDSASMQEVYDELINNDVEVNGNSFFCPIYDEATATTVLLAGTTDKADLWVLKKIIKLVRSGRKVVSIVNGNSDHILPQLDKYNCKLLHRKGDVSYIQFN